MQDNLITITVIMVGLGHCTLLLYPVTPLQRVPCRFSYKLCDGSLEKHKAVQIAHVSCTPYVGLCTLTTAQSFISFFRN